jgi:hypothetical protein
MAAGGSGDWNRPLTRGGVVRVYRRLERTVYRHVGSRAAFDVPAGLPVRSGVGSTRPRPCRLCSRTEAPPARGLGTISRGTPSTRLRRTRYIGLARVPLGHILKAVGLNVLRLGEWFLETARAKTRSTSFVRLMAAATAA